LKYVGVQTIGNAKKRYQEHIEIYTDIFNSFSFDLMYEEVAMMKDIREIFEKSIPYIDKNVRETLYNIMDSSKKGIITREQYVNILNAWSSFSATDINNDNSLDISELKVLIWLIENEEPDDIRVMKYMK